MVLRLLDRAIARTRVLIATWLCMNPATVDRLTREDDPR